MKLRRSLLYVPGNTPGMLQNIPIFGADTVQIDLEDAVLETEKDAARLMVRRFLGFLQSRSMELFVRINPLDTLHGEADLQAVLPMRPDGIRLPKADTPGVLRHLDAALGEYERVLGISDGHFKIIPSIETPLGVLNCPETALASKRVVALAFGAEDFTAAMEIERTKSGEELLAARTRIAWAAKAAGIQAIDTIFPDVEDVDSLRQETLMAKRLGFTGKSLVNPRQIGIVHEVFRPTSEELQHALEVMEAIEEARKRGLGVASLRGKMVDAPVVTRAARTLQTGAALGMIGTERVEEVLHGEE